LISEKESQMPTGTPFVSRRLLTIVQAAAMLEPYYHKNTVNWLADMRRREPWYRETGATPPMVVKHNKVIHYPIEEIERVISELVAARSTTTTPSI
jgi:hypothetical protein